MSFASPLGLLALLAVPAVVALHLFRRRLRERRVAGLFLWVPDRLAAQAGRRRTRLLRTGSLWCEVLAAVVLALWLGGLRLGAVDDRAHLVLVLDDSASMGARAADGESAAARARTAARARIDALPRRSRVTVIRSGVRPAVLVGPAALPAAAQAALDAWQPTAVAHDIAPAWDLALELAGAGGGTRVELLHLTDGMPAATPPPPCAVSAVGVPRPNVALASALRRRAGAGRSGAGRSGAGEELLLLDLQAFGGDAREVQVEVRSAGDAFAPRALAARVGPGRPARVEATLPASDAAWSVDVGPGSEDALALDDHAVLLPEPRREVTLAAPLAAEYAAALDLERVAQALDGVRLLPPADAARADLRFVRSAGEVASGRHEVVVAPLPGERDAWIGPYLIEHRHPLGEGLTLDGVVWSAGRGAVPGVPIVFAGTQVLAAEERVAGGLRLWLQLDVQRSNLPSSPDWPILLDNLVRRVRDLQPGPAAVNLRVGETIEWRPSAGVAEALRLTDPDGSTRPGHGARALVWTAEQPGLHELRGSGGALLQRFAVVFVDPVESDLTTRSSGYRPPTSAPDSSGDADPSGAGALERRVLALLLLALLAGDWWLLRAGRATGAT